jgi:dihydrofolate reductase
MRKLILSMFMSLDGAIEGPGGEFVPPDWSDDMQTHWSDDSIGRADLLIYGRKNFQFQSPFWQAAEADPNNPEEFRSFARLMASIPKLVVSSTLKSADWNAQVAEPDLAAQIARLKQEPGKDIVALGGAALANTLIGLGVVDEYKIMITPTLLPGGTRLFQDGYARAKLELIEARTMDTGAMILKYRPAG